MAGYFNKLRKKPKHVRDNIAFSIAGGFTLVTALAWFFIGFGAPAEEFNLAEEESPAAFSTLLDQIQEQVASAREGIAESKEATSTPPVNNGEWGYALQNASSSRNQLPREASIMIVSSSSASATTSMRATSSVLY